jgi:hypothetical protein
MESDGFKPETAAGNRMVEPFHGAGDDPAGLNRGWAKAG